MYLLSVLLAATLTTASPLPPSRHSPAGLVGRADTTITDALGPVMMSLKSLDTAVNGLTSDPQSAVPILGASDAANKALTTATDTIKGADKLTLIGALGLQSTATGLTTQVQTTVGDLASKKGVCLRASLHPFLRSLVCSLYSGNDSPKLTTPDPRPTRRHKRSR